jgi:Flp pilus assembly pilin Flp
MIRRITRFVVATVRREPGQTMTEYALILAAVAIVAVIAYLALGNAITGLLNTVIACL